MPCMHALFFAAAKDCRHLQLGKANDLASCIKFLISLCLNMRLSLISLSMRARMYLLITVHVGECLGLKGVLFGSSALISAFLQGVAT